MIGTTMVMGLMPTLLTLYVLLQYRRHGSKKLGIERLGLRGSGEPIPQFNHIVP